MTYQCSTRLALNQISENLGQLTPKELTIFTIVQTICKDSTPEELKQSAIRIPKEMRWSEKETAFFHTLLKDVALHDKNLSLDNEQLKLDEQNRNLKFFTRKNVRCTIASLICTFCAWTASTGASLVSNSESLNISPETRQTMQSVSSASDTITHAGQFALALFGGTALFGAGSTLLTRRKQGENAKKHVLTKMDLDENALKLQQLRKEIRQRS